MARPKKAVVANADNKLDESLLQRDPDAQGMPRISGMSETGYSGLKVAAKQIYEESDKAWRMPQRIRTADEMAKDASIAAALQFYTVMLARVPWKVVPPVGATAEQKERAKFVESCLGDMDETWFQTIVAILSHLRYGFSALEKVYKRRTGGNSKYQDGLIGIKGLKPRAQSTITGWIYSDDGRELLGIEQNLGNIQYSERFTNLAQSGTIKIPREKIILFTTNPVNGNPEGVPLLKNAYTAWRMKRCIEDEEVKGAARDLTGLFKIVMPAAYMSADADAGKQAIYNEFKRVVRNVARGEQDGLILPSDTDEASKKPLFDAELMSSSGARAFDTSAIISRWDSRIMVSLFTDILNLGTDGTGSFALAEGKTELVEYGLQYRLKEIADALNQQLVPQLFKMNGWSDTDLPQIAFGDISKPSLDSISKAVQRICATSAVEKDRVFFNMTREAFGLQPFPDDEPVHEEWLNDFTSKSGSGMTEGMSNGEGKSIGDSGDASAGNGENAE